MTKIAGLLAVVLLATVVLPVAIASPDNETRLTNNSAVSRQPDIAVSDNCTYVVWSDNRDGNYEIYYKMLDGGNVAVYDTRLTSTGASSTTPTVAVDATGDVYVVWREGNDIYYLKADSNGTMLISPKWISNANGGTNGHCWEPDIAIGSDGVVHVVWTRRYSNNWIYVIHATLTETGERLTRDTLSSHENFALDHFPRGYSTHPHITIDSVGDSHVVFCSMTGGVWEWNYDSHEIFYSVVKSDGNISVDKMRLTNDLAESNHPSVCVDADDGVHIAWHDIRNGDYDIYYTKIGELDQQRLTFDPADSINPCVASDSSLIHLAWVDEQDGNSSLIYQELYKTGNIIRREQFTKDDSGEPGIAPDGGVVWTDQRDGNEEIYYGKMQTSMILIAHSPDRFTAPNHNATYVLNIINTGGATETLSLSVDNVDSASMAALNQSSAIIAPYSAGDVILNVTDEDLGDYVVHVTASGGDVFESEEICTSVVPPTLDLMVDRVDAYYHTLFGSMAARRRHLNLVNHVRVVVTNNGSLNSDAFNITLLSNGEVVDTRAVSGLGAQSDAFLLFNWTPIYDVVQPLSSVTNSFELTVKVDPGNTISESDETNNNKTLHTDAVWNGYMGGNGMLGDAYLTTKHHDKLRGGVIYDLGDNYCHDPAPVDAYPVNYDVMLPPDATIELAKVYTYFEWYAHSKPYINVSFTNSTGCHDVTSDEENWYWDKAYIGGSAHDLWGMFAYNVTPYIQESGTYTVNIATPDTCIDGAMLFIVYSDPDMPEIEYWMSEGADVLMGGNRFGSNGLHSEDCVARANLTGGTIDTDKVVNTTLLSVSNCADGGLPNAILFNGHTLGWNCFQGAGGTGYSSSVGWNVTTVPVEYLKPDSNMVEMADYGDNMMPANALLIVEYEEQSTTTTVSIADVVLKPDNVVTLPVLIGNITNYGVSTTNIWYNTSVVHVTGVTGSSDSNVITKNINNDIGFARIVTSNLGGVSGDIVLVNVEFMAVGFGSTPLDIDIDVLRDTSHNDISANVSDGSITVSSYLKGDLNHDGDVADSADVTLMNQASVEDINPNSEYDLNGDGDYADSADVTLMNQASVEDITL